MAEPIEPEERPGAPLVRNRPGETPLSEDGRFYWTGQDWQPVPWSTRITPTPPASSARPSLSKRIGRDAIIVAVGTPVTLIVLIIVFRVIFALDGR